MIYFVLSNNYNIYDFNNLTLYKTKIPVHFRSTYKYAFDDWSVYSKPFKETITNNVAESHNNLLSARMGEHPSLQKFEAKLVEIEKE